MRRDAPLTSVARVATDTFASLASPCLCLCLCLCLCQCICLQRSSSPACSRDAVHRMRRGLPVRPQGRVLEAWCIGLVQRAQSESDKPSVAWRRGAPAPEASGTRAGAPGAAICLTRPQQSAPWRRSSPACRVRPACMHSAHKVGSANVPAELPSSDRCDAPELRADLLACTHSAARI